MFGPWTDQPSELQGWDVERFQAIAASPGVDLEVEYPPGSVLLIESISNGPGPGHGVVATHRYLVALSLVVDLAVAALLERRAWPNVGLLYLWLGLPLVPAGLLRFDLWATGLGAVALLTLDRPVVRGRSSAAQFGLATAAGFAVKLTPGLLLPVAIAAGKKTEAAAALAGIVGVCVAWLTFGGFESVEAVTSLRGATGWHVESVPGSITALVTDQTSRFEANAYRIGTLRPWAVTIGRFVTVGLILGFMWRLRTGMVSLRRMSLMLLGCTSALIVTSPLISPQFLLWLVPAAALAWPEHAEEDDPEEKDGAEEDDHPEEDDGPEEKDRAEEDDSPEEDDGPGENEGESVRARGRLRRDRPTHPTWIAGGAIILTAGVLGTFGPPGVDHPVAAGLLLVRSGLLVALVVACWREIAVDSLRSRERLAGE